MNEDESKPRGKRAAREEKTELGFSTPVAEDAVEALTQSFKGNYDLTRLRERNPKLIGLVEMCLGFGIPWSVIQQHSGLDWSTIDVIARDEKRSIQEFKARNAAKIQVLIEAGNGVLLEKIQRGEYTFLDAKLLWDQLAAQSDVAGSITEVRHTTAAADAMAELMAQIAAGMGRDAGNVSAMRDVTPPTADETPKALEVGTHVLASDCQADGQQATLPSETHSND